MDKFKDRYRIQSTRLQNWDYGNNGDYFITICTHGMENFFGKVSDNKMILNDMGKIAYECWKSIPKHFIFSMLDSFVIMPNHVHGIITLNKPLDNNKPHYFSGSRFRNPGRNNVSSIIGSYKSAVSKSIHKTVPMFSWQPRFYDSIIFGYDSYLRIKKYIESNPANWDRDKYFNDRYNY